MAQIGAIHVALVERYEISNVLASLRTRFPLWHNFSRALAAAREINVRRTIMSESEEGKVVEGGLVVSMRPQVSVELNSYGGVVISTASISDDFRNVDHNDVRFPAECAREIADELYRLTGGAPAPARTENEKRADVISQPTGRDGHQQDEDGEKYPF